MAMRLMSLCEEHHEEHHVQTAPGPTSHGTGQITTPSTTSPTTTASASITPIVSNKSSNSNRRQFTVSTAYEQTQRCRVATILQTLKIHEAVIEAARSVQNSSILINTANPHLHLHHTTHHYLTSNTHAHKHKHVCSVTHQGDHLSLFIAGNDAAELEANSEDLRKERG